jgi:hypothetical protein
LYSFPELELLAKRGSDDDLGERVTYCGLSLYMYLSYLCQKYNVGGGKKRTAGYGDQDPILQNTIFPILQISVKFSYKYE